MNNAAFVQRNPYKGKVPRGWIRIRLAAPDGTVHEREMVADTGSPCAIILSVADLNLLMNAGATGMNSNFGHLIGGWLELQMPELGLVRPIRGYGNDTVNQAVAASSPDFSGVVGLPFLRLTEFGGDADHFWLRPAAAVP